MKVHREILIELACGNKHFCTPGGNVYSVIKNTLISSSRWSLRYKLIFQINRQDYYEVSYSKGATEQQDESPFEYSDEYVECQQVWPHQVTTTVYRPEPLQ